MTVRVNTPFPFFPVALVIVIVIVIVSLGGGFVEVAKAEVLRVVALEVVETVEVGGGHEVDCGIIDPGQGLS